MHSKGFKLSSGSNITVNGIASHVCNFNRKICSSFSIVVEKQQKVAQIAEMIHTASLVHDDVIDGADSRRGRPSVNILWGQKKVKLSYFFSSQS